MCAMKGSPAWYRRNDPAPISPDLAAARRDLAEARWRTGRLRDLLIAIAAEIDDDPPHAPGHCHGRPGIWDDDNTPDLAGQPCEWCATWAVVRAEIAGNGPKYDRNVDAVERLADPARHEGGMKSQSTHHKGA